MTQHNGLGSPNNCAGITFIEIIIAMALIGVMALFIAPPLERRGTQSARFFERLQTLLDYGVYRAVTTHTDHRLLFDLTKQPIVMLTVATDERNSADQVIYKPLDPRAYIITEVAIPPELTLRQLYINGTDYIPGGILKTAWINISAQGLIQPCVINSFDTHAQRIYGCVINPITAHISCHNEPQKP